MQLADAADSEQDRVLYITAAFSGLRRSELLALRWRTVDFDSEALRTGDSYGPGELSRAKAGRARTIPTVERVEAGGAEAPHAASGSCLPRLPGRLHGLVGAARRRVAALRRADRRALRFHDLRHTFASLARQREGALDAAVFSRDLLLAKVRAQRC
jgi:integrase